MSVKRKVDFPVGEVRRYLEPGPIVLVSSAHRGRRNVMTLGWHMMLGFTPSLVACYVWDANRSFAMLRASRECVINVPTTELTDVVVGIGNCSGAEVDKFAEFELTAEPSEQVKAPRIAECYANFECKLADSSMVGKYNFFIWEVVQAHVASRPKYPQTLHYTGDGVFMVAGKTINTRRDFKPEML